MVLFRCFIDRLSRYGLEDPMTALPSRCLSMATDFETTFAKCIVTSLSEKFQSGSALIYAKRVCIGCDKHAKRICREKTGTHESRAYFQWAIGTRDNENETKVTIALSEMQKIDDKWSAFSE